MEEEEPVVRIPKSKGEEVLARLKDEGELDSERRIESRGDELLIPVKSGGDDLSGDLRKRERKSTPYQKIKEKVDLDEKKVQLLPDRWEKVGEIVLIKLPDELYDVREKVGKAYADVLNAKSVLIQGDIRKITREPEVELIYDDETETVHLENGVKYHLDVTETMFSSGNIDERIRMGGVVKKGETIVDMFAGIGYFTLPMAVHGEPEKIYALEINPTAFEYLEKNVEENGVTNIVEPWLGDNRDFSLNEECADRVVMGYLKDTWKFLPKTLELLGNQGTIHYHRNVDDESYPEGLRKELEQHISDFEVKKKKMIKSFAPHVYHVVWDVKV